MKCGKKRRKKDTTMYIIQVGIHYGRVALEKREKFIFTHAEGMRETVCLQQYEHVLENVLLSTCNRTEVYAVVDDVSGGMESIIQFMANCFAVSIDLVEELVDVRVEAEAVEHLFGVICGMDSMARGETEILGQMRKAFLGAQEAGTTGTLFNGLFKQAITFAKGVHHRLELPARQVSVSQLAFNLSEEIVADVISKKIVIVGVGTIGKQLLEQTLAAGARNVTLLNRTVERARELAEGHGVYAGGLEALEGELLTADVVFFATGIRGFRRDVLLQKEEVVRIQTARNLRKLCLIDLAVPRNVDARVARVANVALHDLDDVDEGLAENKVLQKEIAGQIEGWVSEAAAQFAAWRKSLVVVPMMQALQSKKAQIKQGICHSIARKLPELTASEERILEKHIASTLNQLLEAPIASLKQISLQANPVEELRLFGEIFGLSGVEEVKEEEVKCEHSLLVAEKVN